MGLRVGVVTGDDKPGDGGSWTFSTTLLEALKTAQSPHSFIVLDGIPPGEESHWPAGGRLRLSPQRRPIQAMARIGIGLASKAIPQTIRRAIGG